MTPDLQKALEARREAIKRDDECWFAMEEDVARWSADTLFPQAIDRWVREIGERARG